MIHRLRVHSLPGLVAAAVAFTSISAAVAQQAITLARSAATDPSAAISDHETTELTPAEAQGYRHFGSAKLRPEPQSYTLNFRQGTKLTSIAAKGDFEVTGGSCSEGRTYIAGESCTVEMVFTPTAPGHRTGKLVVSHTASATPFVVPAGGEGTGPAVSFIPALVATVPATMNSSNTAGLIYCNTQIAIDGGDNLYIPDCKLENLDYVDSSGALGTVLASSSWDDPTGVATDAAGDVYVAESGDSVVGVVYADETWHHILDPQGASTGCTFLSPCLVTVGGKHQAFHATPARLASDPAGNVYVDGFYGYNYTGILSPQTALYPGTDGNLPFNFNFWYLFTPWSSETNTLTLGADANSNLYTTNNVPSNVARAVGESTECYIYGQNPQYGNQQPGGKTWVVAGTRNCGYSGDGGFATGAEISAQQGGFAWDVAGNFYFTDTGNNVIRRIDAQTGIIHTIAGTGKAVLTVPSGQATAAALYNPTGIAVDSNGNVFFSSNMPSGIAVSEILSSSGSYTFPNQVMGTSSAARFVTLSNTGNAPLNFTHLGFSSGGTSFAVDPLTTTCNFEQGLAAGGTCQIGIIFSPAAAAEYSGLLELADNATNGVQSIQLFGTGVTPGLGVFTPTNGLFFGIQATNTTSTAQQLTLTNTGGGPLSILSYPQTIEQFSVSSTTCSAVLAGGASCIFNIVFSPTQYGEWGANFRVQANGSPVVGLSGLGATAAASIFFAGATFPTEPLGSASTPVYVTITNTGIPAVTISKVTITGADAGDYSQTNTCSLLSKAGSTCYIKVIFKPTATGTRTAILGTVNSAGLTNTVSLTGAATAAPAVKPKVALTSKTNPVVEGKAVSLSSEVIASSSITPTGKVELKEGNKVLATSTLSGGAATFRVSDLSTGTHSLTAWYLGDSAHAPSESATVKQVVVR